MRILISAYGCSPGRGSEPGVGWNWSKQTACVCDVWVLSPESERVAIEQYTGGDLPSNLHFVFCDLPKWIRPSNKQGTLFRYHLHYYFWQIAAYLKANNLHKTIHFDVMHHLTLGAHWKPSFLHWIRVPFMWGPVGGGEALPLKFFSQISFNGWLSEGARIIVRLLCEYDPFLRSTAKRAHLILAKTQETAIKVSKLGGRMVQVTSEAALPSLELERLNVQRNVGSRPFRFLSVGRLLHWKAFELGIRAFAKAYPEIDNCEFWLVGDGPERCRLERVARRLGIASAVYFFGNLERSEALKLFADCDVLVHPSLHDSGGWVCIEAMASGLPVICLDLGGPGIQVNEEVGIKIPALSPDQVISEMSSAMEVLVANPSHVARLSEAARRYAHHRFAWEQRTDELRRLYERVAGVSVQQLVVDRQCT